MARSRDIALFFGGTVLSQIVTFGSGVLVARWLGPSDFGVLSLVRNVYAVAAILAPLGLDLSLLRRLGENDGDWLRSLAQVQRFRLICAAANLVVLALAAVAVGPWIGAHVYRQPHFATLLGLAFLALPFAGDLAILGATFRALDRPALQNLVGLYLQPLVRLIALAVFLVVGFGVGGVVASTAVGAAVAAAALSLALVWVRRREGFGRHRLEPADEAAIGAVFRYSAWLAVMLLFYLLLRSIDILVLGLFRSPAEVGSYAALSAIGYLIAVFPQAVSQTLGPTVARLHASGDVAAVRRELSTYLRQAVLLSSPLFAGIAAFGPWLDLIFGARFQFPPGLCLVLALVYLVSGCLGQMGVSLTMTGRHRLEFAVLAVGVAGALAACFALAPPFGGLGVGLAVLGGYVVVNGLRTLLSARFLGGLDVAWSDVLPPAACLAVAFAWREVLQRLFPHDWPTAIGGAAALIVVFIGLYALVLLRPGEKALIAAKLASWRRRTFLA